MIKIIGDSILYCNDCFNVFPILSDIKVNAIIADLPYGSTECSWDSILDLDKLWSEYKRIRLDTTPIILFGNEPFSTIVRSKNLDEYKYDWKWNKKLASNFVTCKIRPLNIFEDIMVFYKKQCTYNPQMEIGKAYTTKQSYVGEVKSKSLKRSEQITVNNGTRYPTTILTFNKERGLHPTQKPVALLEYLIKTYSNEGDLILDNTMGSGSTGVACAKLNRKFIGIEKEKKYFDIAVNRIEFEYTKKHNYF